jgi:pilus assembly protein CpaE
VVDLPANWTNWTLALVAEADIVLLVVTLNIASLRQGKRQIQLLRSQGIDPARIHVLVNRIEQRLFKTIGPEDAAKALGHPVSLSIHNDYPLVNGANNQGVLLADLGKRSKVARDYAKIAETVTTLVEQAA